MGYSREDAYSLFSEAVDTLISANYILTARPITDLMKVIVYNDMLKSFIAECNAGIDYEAELVAAIRRDAAGNYMFELPKSNRVIVSVVTGLLYEFDRGTRSLEDFIGGFYRAKDARVSYNMFCDAILRPFKEAFKRTFLVDISFNETEESDKLTSVVNPSALDQLTGAINILRTDFLSDNKLKETERQDYILLLDCLLDTLDKGEARLAGALWVGVKYTLMGIRRYTKKLKEVESILKQHAVI